MATFELTTDYKQCMEQFKAVEKEMKTKAYSKEGLSQSAKQDPKEKEKEDTCDFLSEQVDECQRILEALDAEEDMLQAAVKKNKRDTSKTDRLSDISIISERYKWHESKLQLLLRAVQNGSAEPNAVNELKEEIEYAIKEGQEAEFDGENEELYDDFNLDQEEAAYGLTNDNDRISSQDAQSVQDETEEPAAPKLTKTKSDSLSTRRPSTTVKSPLPILSTLNTMPPPPPVTKDKDMKPAPVPARPPGEGLKYASAAAAAAASDKSGVGIAPLPPPPGSIAAQSANSVKATSPTPPPPSQLAERNDASRTTSFDDAPSQDQTKSPALSQTSAAVVSVPSSVPATPAMDKAEPSPHPAIAGEASTGLDGDIPPDAEGEESIYHLPPGLQDLIQSFETTKSRVSLPATSTNPSIQRLLTASQETAPEALDAERPRHYKPQFRFNTPAHYPQDTLPIFDDPRLYETGRIDTDTLFYIFYYRQGTYQQYLAAKSLKSQSWRFHKQYQTWFQRHEEPKNITEDFEQGTYRFFDYESTW